MPFPTHPSYPQRRSPSPNTSEPKQSPDHRRARHPPVSPLPKHIPVPPRCRNGSVDPRAVSRLAHYRDLPPRASHIPTIRSDAKSVISGSSRRSSLLSDILVTKSNDSFTAARQGHRAEKGPLARTLRSETASEVYTDEAECYQQESAPLRSMATLSIGGRSPTQSPPTPLDASYKTKPDRNHPRHRKTHYVPSLHPSEHTYPSRSRDTSRRNSRKYSPSTYSPLENHAESPRPAERNSNRSAKPEGKGKLLMVRNKRGETGISRQRKMTQGEKGSAGPGGEISRRVVESGRGMEVEINLGAVFNPFKRSS